MLRKSRPWFNRSAVTAKPLPFDGVFVINLDRRKDRWQHISAELAKCGLLSPQNNNNNNNSSNNQHNNNQIVQRVAAVDCQTLPSMQQLVEKRLVSPLGKSRMELGNDKRVWGMDLNPGGIGCAMSHGKVWATVIERSLSCALVVEDDSLFSSDFVPQYVARFNSGVPSSWELVYLSGLDTENKAAKLIIANGVALVPRLHRTTNCYVVNAKGAKRLLELAFPLSFQLDTQMTLHQSPHPENGEMFVSQPECYTMMPPLVVQATRFGSDIQAEQANHDYVDEERSRCRAAGWDV